MKSWYPSKAWSRRNAVHKHESFAIPDPLIPERRILFLTGGIQHFQHTGRIIDNYLLPIGIFDCRVVRLDKVIQAKLSLICQSQILFREGLKRENRDPPRSYKPVSSKQFSPPLRPLIQLTCTMSFESPSQRQPRGQELFNPICGGEPVLAIVGNVASGATESNFSLWKRLSMKLAVKGGRKRHLVWCQQGRGQAREWG